MVVFFDLGNFSNELFFSLRRVRKFQKQFSCNDRGSQFVDNNVDLVGSRGTALRFFFSFKFDTVNMATPAKKQKKCAATFSVLPADGEVDLEAMRAKVRSVEHESLVWGEGSIEPFVFGLQKLVIGAYVNKHFFHCNHSYSF